SCSYCTSYIYGTCCSLCNHTATTQISTLSLHDALPISTVLQNTTEQLRRREAYISGIVNSMPVMLIGLDEHLQVTQWNRTAEERSEEHTSELQSRENLVCRLLLEKKKYTTTEYTIAQQ